MLGAVGALSLHGKPGVQVSRNDSQPLFSKLWLLVLGHLESRELAWTPEIHTCQKLKCT